MNVRLAKRNYNIQQWKTIIQDRNNTNLYRSPKWNKQAVCPRILY